MKEKERLVVLNIGAKWFVSGVESQGVKLFDIEWSPPVKLDNDISSILGKLGRR